MSTTVNKGWLKTDQGEKIAPKTLLSQVLTVEGESAENYINDAVYIDEDNTDGDMELEETEESITVDSELSEVSENPVQNKIVTKGLKGKLSLPQTNNTLDHGTLGQFAVSDGNGGITWRTLVEAEEVAY